MWKCSEGSSFVYAESRGRLDYSKMCMACVVPVLTFSSWDFVWPLHFTLAKNKPCVVYLSSLTILLISSLEYCGM